MIFLPACVDCSKGLRGGQGLGQANLQPPGDQERASPQPPGPVPSGPSNERGLWRLASRNPGHMAPGTKAPPSGIQGARALGSELGGLPHKAQAGSGLPPYASSAYTPYWLSRAPAAGSGGFQGGPVTCVHCPLGQGLGLRTALWEGATHLETGPWRSRMWPGDPSKGSTVPGRPVWPQGICAAPGAGRPGRGRAEACPSGPRAQKKLE